MNIQSQYHIILNIATEKLKEIEKKKAAKLYVVKSQNVSLKLTEIRQSTV